MRRALVILMLALALPGCGFQPMYGAKSTAGGPSVTQKMATIDIRPIPDRLGQVVRNELVDAIAPLGKPDQPVYELGLLVGEEREDVGPAPERRRHPRQLPHERQVRAARDRHRQGGADRHNWAETAFDIVQQDYPTVIAQQDAQKRLAVELAEEIKTRIAVFFAQGK